MPVTLRIPTGRPLTNSEIDGNFQIMVVTDTPQEFTGAKVFTLTTLTDTTTVTWDCDLNQVCFLQLTNAVGATRQLNPTNIRDGGTYIMVIAQDPSTPGQSFTYPASTFQASGGTAPTFSSTAGAVDVLTWVARGGKLIFADPVLDVQDI